MEKFNQIKQYIGSVSWIQRLALVACLVGMYRMMPFVVQDIPLGYDPGLYKSMMEQYHALLPSRQFADLAPRIQQMYEPFFGMLSSLLLEVGVSSERVLTRGIGLLSLLVGGGLYVFVKQTTKNTPAALFSLILYRTSFVHRGVFRRSYHKQLLGSFLLLIVLGLRAKGRGLYTLPIIAALFLTNRPAGVILVLLLGGYMLLQGWRRIRHRDRGGSVSQLRSIVLWTFGAGVVALPVYAPLLDAQFSSFFAPFFKTLVTMPTYDDGFQDGGTFLTMYELMRTNRHILAAFLLSVAGGVVWWLKKRTFPRSVWLVIPGVICTAWIVFQRFFYQRMVGYADLFWLAWSSVLCAWAWSMHRSTRGIVVVFLVFHAITMLQRSSRLRRPLIDPAEFAFLPQIATLTPEDALILVPGTMYSPRVQGWGGREVIAPGLFDITPRGRVEQGWTTSRRDQDTEGKCAEIAKTYNPLDRPLYLREGSKTVYVRDHLVRSNITPGACFTLLASGERPSWSFWRIDLSD